ncbi:MAG: TetR/AcrR family transcriptional regulator [Acidobacteria bacterium]|nr:TetR/AcrR family transcriptional regulator [Acidobacteriota bacterium]
MAVKLDKREKILKAALEVFTKKGFHASSMAMVAKKAGISVGTIYIYFKNEEDLIQQLFYKIKEKMNSSIKNIIKDEMELREKFVLIWSTILKYLLNHPEEFRYLEQHFNSPYGIKKRRECLIEDECLESPPPIIKLFRDGKKQKILKNFPDEILFALSLGPLVFLARESSLHFVKPDDKIIKECAQSCLKAILND